MESEDVNSNQTDVADTVTPGIGDRVLIHPGTDEQQAGVVVEDFGDEAGHPVDIAGHRVAEAARRWAVSLDAGGLLFIDDSDIVAEGRTPTTDLPESPEIGDD